LAHFPDGVNWPKQALGPSLRFDAGGLEARVFQDSGHIELAGPDLAGQPLANVVQLSPPAVLTAAGPVVFGKVHSSAPRPNGLSLRQAVGGAEIGAELTFVHDGVLRYEVIDWGPVVPVATAISGPSNAQEHFYGLGEKFNALDQSGHLVDILTFDDPGTKHDHSYKVAPWFVSTRGYGFHLDSSAESTFDLRASTPDRFVVTNHFPKLAVNLVYGPALTDVLTRYTGYSGRPPLPPPWVFGVWISSDIWRSGGEVRYAVTQFRDRGIPASGFVFDSPWETAYNDFTFNMTQFGADATIEGVHYPGFASLADLMGFLRANGLKVVCWMAPFVNVTSDDEQVAGQNLGQAANYSDGAAKGAFVRQSRGGAPLVVPWWKGRGSPVDFTTDVGRVWLLDQLRRLVEASAVVTASGATEPVIGGFKTDDGESGNGPNTYIPLTAAYADGRSGVEMRNGYCIEYHKAVSSVLGTAGTLFARSGFTGTHAFPGYWGGDNEPNFGDNGLPSVIVAGQSAAMSGYSIWGHDVGGYQDTNFSRSRPNLFMRWAQFGCFSPIMQMHRQVGAELQYPWRFGDAALANYQFFARLHLRLFPYIYTYAKESAATGVPIIRPLVLLDPADTNTFSIEHAYRFGNELLVAPMIAPDATTRQVYLPTGDWLDFWTNARHPGTQNLTWTNANQAQFPLFVRDGSILPMLLDDVRTLCDANYVNDPNVATNDGSWLVQMYPNGTSTFTVFDGTQLQCQGSATAGTATIASPARRVTFRILGDRPTTVARDGTPVAPQTPGSAGGLGWRYDAATRFIEVAFEHSGDTSTVEYNGA
jgi:alpha-D-xyloside xylohydrolase